MNRGVLYGIAAYMLWGLLPIYWKALQSVPALEILANRMVWSLVFCLTLLALRREWRWLPAALSDLRTVLIFTGAALLLTVNWGVYIWAVNAGFIIETSLGYFINPLVNVLIGVIVLHEQLRVGQWVAVGLAAIGVLYLTIVYGSLPWIALTLAFSFGSYGLLKKKVRLGPLEGLSLETALLTVPALLYLIWLAMRGENAFGQGDMGLSGLLIGAGVVTAIPLLFFAAAAQRIPLSLIGILQYIAPSIQLLIGIFIYREPFNFTRLVGFAFIWAALVTYTVEGARRRRQRQRIVAMAARK